jgi:AcrR family transcriptional regulator
MEALTKILVTARDQFRKYGFKTVTMDDVARAAGISKKTLYQHFETKADVVKAAMLHHHENMICDCRLRMDESENAIEAMVRIMAQMDTEFRQINPMAILELRRFFPEAFRLFSDKLMAENADILRQNITNGIREGYYREDLNPELLAMYRIETSLAVFHPDSSLTAKYSPYDANHQIAEHFLYGLLTPKGEKLYIRYKEKYLQPTK